MIVNYQTADGHTINWDTGGSVLTQEDICNIAFNYSLMHPDKLPTHVWMRTDVYTEYAKIHHRIGTVAYEDGQPCLMVLTGCGILIVKPLPHSFSKFAVLIGTKQDYDNYFIDEVFEEEVLKDCERE